mmetsp:Transcript_31307/g.61140  ORF Transcript_31307/g.61140 Transcript_31307/m.61140 type:complete len:211 (+) Transcript_31307:739-1371(+)
MVLLVGNGEARKHRVAVAEGTEVAVGHGLPEGDVGEPARGREPVEVGLGGGGGGGGGHVGARVEAVALAALDEGKVGLRLGLVGGGRVRVKHLLEGQDVGLEVVDGVDNAVEVILVEGVPPPVDVVGNKPDGHGLRRRLSPLVLGGPEGGGGLHVDGARRRRLIGREGGLGATPKREGGGASPCRGTVRGEGILGVGPGVRDCGNHAEGA